MTVSSKTIEIGKLGKAIGLHGEIAFHYSGDTPENLKSYKTLLLEGERLVELKHIKYNSKKITLGFEGISSRQMAESLTGLKVYILREQLPNNTDKNSFYSADLIGLSATNSQRVVIGTVTGINNFGAQDVLEITLLGGKKKLIAFVKDAVKVPDFTQKTLEINEEFLV